MMKRLLVFVLATVILTLSVFPQAIAYSQETETTQTVYELDDGGYLIITMEDVTSASDMRAARASKTCKKTATYADSNGNKKCALTVVATFSITTGKSVSCTNVTYETASYDDNWSVEDVSTSRNNSSTAKASGTATGEFVRRVLGIKNKTVDASVSVYCDYNGNYS